MHVAITPDLVTMLNTAGQEDEATILELESLVSAPERERPLQDVEDLVLCGVRVVARLFTGPSRVFDERQATARTSLSGLQDELRAMVAVGPAVADLERVWMDRFVLHSPSWSSRHRGAREYGIPASTTPPRGFEAGLRSVWTEMPERFARAPLTGFRGAASRSMSGFPR